MIHSSAANGSKAPSLTPAILFHNVAHRMRRVACLRSKRRVLAPLLFLTSLLSLHAQKSPPSAAGSDWQHVKALPIHARLHVATDHGGKTCRLFAVTDDTLTCSKGDRPGEVLQRAEIKHIKIAHYGRSALVGAGVGGGIGAVAGGIAGRSKPCPTGQGFCLNGIGIGAGGLAAIFGIAGGLAGGIVGGVTDLARGSSVYSRP